MFRLFRRSVDKDIVAALDKSIENLREYGIRAGLISPDVPIDPEPILPQGKRPSNKEIVAALDKSIAQLREYAFQNGLNAS